MKNGFHSRREKPAAIDFRADAGNTVNFWPVPNLLLQKLPAPKFTVTTELDFSQLAVGGKAGLIVMGMDYSYLAVERTAANFRLIRATSKDAHKGDAESSKLKRNGAGDSIFLRVEVDEGARCHFQFPPRRGKFFCDG